MKSVNQVIGKIDKRLIKEYVCKKCGKDAKIYEMPLIGGPNKGKMDQFIIGCKCNDRQIARQVIETSKRLRKEKQQENLIQTFRNYSLINKELQKKTLHDYKPLNQSQNKALQTTKSYIKTFQTEQPKNLLYCGGQGVGKSHLAKVITDGVMKKGYTTIFISVPKLMRKIRSSFQDDTEMTEEQIFKVLENIDLLVLDDIGTEKSSEWVKEKLFDLIDTRQGMNTIYTTNYSPDDLVKILGRRVGSRILNEHYTDVVEILGHNYRYIRK